MRLESELIIPHDIKRPDLRKYARNIGAILVRLKGQLYLVTAQLEFIKITYLPRHLN